MLDRTRTTLDIAEQQWRYTPRYRDIYLTRYGIALEADGKAPSLTYKIHFNRIAVQ
ncbi:MAG TPA: hypothetical protein VL522_21735 [Bordetella sp.]|nr:hypothetical protein [Bordetella sp.]